MLSYLKGKVSGIQTGGNRTMLLLEVNQIGYEIQILPRLTRELPDEGEIAQVFTHLQIRDDQWTLYGFGALAERDLFRHLISVSGIGAQLALALLDTLELSVLVQAIVTGNTRTLVKAPGVGEKTADRIALELKTKLAQWRDQAGFITTPSALPVASVQEDVEMTLLALGYTPGEISQALQAVGQNTALAKNAEVESWIREAITWLSQTL